MKIPVLWPPHAAFARRHPSGLQRQAQVMRQAARTLPASAPGRQRLPCYEAGYDGFWLHRVLVAAGIASLVVDPASLQVDRRARRAKTDLCGRPTVVK